MKVKKFTINDVLKGKSPKQREKILKDKLLTQIYCCLYLCPGNCKTDPTCPWKKAMRELK